MAGLNFQTAHVRLPQRAVSGNWARRVCFRGKETRGKRRTLADLNFLAPQASGVAQGAQVFSSVVSNAHKQRLVDAELASLCQH